MATFIQIRRMLQLAPVIAFFLFVSDSDSAEAAGTAMAAIAALQPSNFDSVGRDRIWIGQQSLALPSIQPTQRSWLRSLLPSTSRRKLLGDTPVETYFLPISETQLLISMDIVNKKAAPPLRSVNSIALAADGTVVWYDHHEDGYETDVINPTQIGSTEVWGDGNAANGCAPPLRNTANCTDGADYLTAGTVIILEDDVPLPRDTSTLLWDGGDRIQSSFPVAITRGAYSGGEPGSLLGGAVEVLNTDSWGTNFESPVGVGMVDDIENNVGPGQGLNSFQLTEFHVMAAEDGTIVDLPGGPFTVTFDDGSEQIVLNTDPAVSTTFQLNMGETLRISGSLILKADGKRGGGVDGGIKVGDGITSNKPVQVTLVSGDEKSAYELRWYGLLPTTQWASDYYTPVGDDRTRVYLYNPSDTETITVSVDNVAGSAVDTIVIPPGTYGMYEIPTEGSGYRFYTSSGEPFYGLTQTDDALDEQGKGAFYDWGHPLLPATGLTSKVIVGFSYGCKDPSNCPVDSAVGHPPSPVWLTPVAAADILIDYDSDGIIDETIANVSPLEGIFISDSDDWDMSGATISAVSTSDPLVEVDIAAAWGQNPDYTLDEAFNLDMGTVVLPLPAVSGEKTCELVADNDGDGKISPGDELRCTIRVTNTGQKEIDSLKFVEDLSNLTSYVEGSMTCCGNTTVPDSPDGSAFPLDSEGYTTTDMNLEVGGADSFTYNIVVNDLADIPNGEDTIIDTGAILDPLNNDAEMTSLDTRTQFQLTPDVEISKTIVPEGSSCPGDDTVTVDPEVTTYIICYNVTNTGNTPLDSVEIVDPDVDITDPIVIDTFVDIGGSASYQVSYSVPTSTTDLSPEVTTTANPVYPDGSDIANKDDVSATDTATFALATSAPSVSLMPSARPSISMQPTITATLAPSVSKAPTTTPTSSPSTPPTFSALPSSLPSDVPSQRPSFSPSDIPSDQPTITWMPSTSPSDQPSLLPSSSPSALPTDVPSDQPSRLPSSSPSDVPSDQPTISWMPSTSPSDYPSLLPSSSPSDVPTDIPSNSPSSLPSDVPSPSPSAAPSISLMPTTSPSIPPTGYPTFAPTTAEPTYLPEPRTEENTICRQYNMTAVESMVLRSFLFKIETMDCIEVIVEYKHEGDTMWNTMCFADDIWGQHPNATLLHSKYCTEVIIMEGETVEFRLQTAPSNQCIHGMDGYAQRMTEIPWFQTMDVYYSYEQNICPPPTAMPTGEPSGKPSGEPSGAPFAAPSAEPSRQPSGQPSMAPFASPSAAPSGGPSIAPSKGPTAAPTVWSTEEFAGG